ncbi:MAG: enoyl-CoA hydratase-related protein [Actinobacteria bacterium]|jgi:enoyl-CoA hydratase|nr:enoyl-CoA hydratase-related protein [Actinomycetota bacterium]MCL6095715.1 enoyl-CoA hydratase-related protein [Actinomycetota bacterium]
MAVGYEINGHVATVTLNSPETLNALTLDDLKDLAATWEAIEDNPECYVVILTGAGSRAFCSGADLGSLIPLITEQMVMGNDPRDVLASFKEIRKAFLKEPLSKPIVAAVNGYCVAGGLELLQATDIRLAVPEARFSLQEARWGLFPVGGSTVRLPRQIPFTRAMDILLTARMLSAEEALQCGLIGRLVSADELANAAKEVADRIALNGPIAVQAIKRSVLACMGLPDAQAFEVELGIGAKVFASHDAREGPAAFMGKRVPMFRNK